MRSRDRDHPDQNGETLSLLKNTKICWVWWYTLVVPATREAEVEEPPEPPEAEVAVSRDCTTVVQPGDRVRLPLKKKKNQMNNTY